VPALPTAGKVRPAPTITIAHGPAGRATAVASVVAAVVDEAIVMTELPGSSDSGDSTNPGRLLISDRVDSLLPLLPANCLERASRALSETLGDILTRSEFKQRRDRRPIQRLCGHHRCASLQLSSASAPFGSSQDARSNCESRSCVMSRYELARREKNREEIFQTAAYYGVDPTCYAGTSKMSWEPTKGIHFSASSGVPGITAR